MQYFSTVLYRALIDFLFPLTESICTAAKHTAAQYTHTIKSNPLISFSLSEESTHTHTHSWSLEHAPDVQSTEKENAVRAFHSSDAVPEIAERLSTGT